MAAAYPGEEEFRQIESEASEGKVEWGDIHHD